MRYAILHVSIKTPNGTVFRTINVNINMYDDAVKMIYNEFKDDAHVDHVTFDFIETEMERVEKIIKRELT